MKFTDSKLKSLKPRKARYEVFEDGRPGFGLRVSPQSTKTFIFLYRYHGRPRRMSLGRYLSLSLADAHLKHSEAVTKLEKDIDPADQLAEERDTLRKAPTVKQLVQEYLETYARRYKKTWVEDQRMLYKDVIPRWGQLRARDITRRDVIRLLDDIVARGAPVKSNRTKAVV
ncbi:MAG: Arm DNA-binding domain-containing protein, partial [Gammaproteobacteria bacterium]